MSEIIDRPVGIGVAESAVGRVITAMAEHLGEPLTVDDLARTAMFSKFHFCRIFQRVTGISPGRFLSAMRLQEAKRLLLCGGTSVTDISYQVGYRSVGTFCTRFRRAVGISPTEYRQLGGLMSLIVTDPAEDQRHPRAAGVVGQVGATVPDPAGPILVGLFRDRISEGQPVGYTILAEPGPFRLTDVPPGAWFLLAHAFGPEDRIDGPLGVSGPITVRSADCTVRADVVLRRRSAFDPPRLLAHLAPAPVRLPARVG